MDEHAAALADAIDVALPGWVDRSVEAVMERAGMPVATSVRADAEQAGAKAVDEVGSAVRELLATDIDEQRTTPLTLLRDAVRFPSAVLARAGVEPDVVRDDAKVRLFPDDVYDLAPATFADVDPRLVEPGIAWGAAKAFEHLRRHKSPEDGDRQ